MSRFAITPGPIPKDKAEAFRVGLRELINKHSMENYSSTPDFILAEYLMSCLENYNITAHRVEGWYER